MKGFFIAAIMVCSLQIANAKEKQIVLNTANVCSLEGEVSHESMRKVKLCLVDQMIKRRGRNYPLYLYVDSPGGSVYAGVKFVEFVKTVKNLHTVTSFAASMAAAIVEQIPGDRYIVDSGIFMFHRARGNVSGQMGNGELESRLALWKHIIKKSEIAQAKRIGITLKEYQSNIINEWWTVGSQAVEKNIADEIVTVKCSMRLSQKKEIVIVKGFFGTSKVEVSKCPLLN